MPSPLQLLFLAGMTITIGVQATIQFFSRRKNRKVRVLLLLRGGSRCYMQAVSAEFARRMLHASSVCRVRKVEDAAADVSVCLQGSAFYLSGAVLVIVGWTIIGLCVEAYGFWLLFCEFLPTVLQFSRRVPFMSKVLDMPFLKVVSVCARHPQQAF